ncbi:hypothetical protein Y1Q_0011520 [Alligator mississippiensis]|uniref:Uncharacterized protein n=1 Tax=Alligator mississippiensis TaxID=8496 RepID=A0A151M019_ALLMI|nr:hypothetical protein Y1Q_0011520 [Alligator mississippiensis]
MTMSSCLLVYEEYSGSSTSIRRSILGSTRSLESLYTDDVYSGKATNTEKIYSPIGSLLDFIGCSAASPTFDELKFQLPVIIWHSIYLHCSVQRGQINSRQEPPPWPIRQDPAREGAPCHHGETAKEKDCLELGAELRGEGYTDNIHITESFTRFYQ